MAPHRVIGAGMNPVFSRGTSDWDVRPYGRSCATSTLQGKHEPRSVSIAGSPAS